MSDRVHFLGFRDDVKQLYKTADIFCLPSYREGLSASVMEAMAASLPVVCSDIRGNKDLIVQDKGGYLISIEDTHCYADSLNAIIQSERLRVEMGTFNMNYVKLFSLKKVVQDMEAIYMDIINMDMKGGNHG